MKRLLVAILAAAFVLGGHVAVQAQTKEEQPYLKAALRCLAEIDTRERTIKEAREHVGKCRAEIDLWRDPVERATVQTAAPLPVVAAYPVEKPPVVAAPIAKPPVVAVPVPVKEKSKAVEQAKVQAPAKLQKPPVAASSPPSIQTAKTVETAHPSVKVYAMKIPLEKDTTIRGVLYRKNEPLWAIIRETKEGKIVDKDGKLASGPELAKAPPRGAILVPFKAPQI